MYKNYLPKKVPSITNIGIYIERNAIVTNTPGGIDEFGNSYRFFAGKKISEADFLKMHPPVILVKNKFNKGENIGCIN